MTKHRDNSRFELIDHPGIGNQNQSTYVMKKHLIVTRFFFFIQVNLENHELEAKRHHEIGLSVGWVIMFGIFIMINGFNLN